MILSGILEGDKKQLPVDGSVDDVISSSPFNLRLLYDMGFGMADAAFTFCQDLYMVQ